MGFPTAVLYGEGHIYVGHRAPPSTRGSRWPPGYHPTQEGLPDRVLSIGDHSVIGMRSGIVAHESITIGDDVWFGQEIYVTDANHGYSDPATPPGKQLGAHTPVVIGDGCWIGHGSVILAGHPARQARGGGGQLGGAGHVPRPLGDRRRPGQGHPLLRARRRLGPSRRHRRRRSRESRDDRPGAAWRRSSPASRR